MSWFLGLLLLVIIFTITGVDPFLAALIGAKTAFFIVAAWALYTVVTRTMK